LKDTQPYSSAQITSENPSVQLVMLYQPRLELASFRYLKDLRIIYMIRKSRKSLKMLPIALDIQLRRQCSSFSKMPLVWSNWQGGKSAIP